MGIPQGPEILVILVVVMLLFGTKKVPRLARSLGQSAKELRKGFDEDDPSEPESTSAPSN